MNSAYALMPGEHSGFHTVPASKAVKLPSIHANYAIDYRLAGPRVITKAPWSASRRQKPLDMQAPDYEIQLLRQQLAVAQQQAEVHGSMLAMHEQAEEALSSQLQKWEFAKSTLADLHAAAANASDMLHQRYLADFADNVYMCGRMYTHVDDTEDYINQRQLSLTCLAQAQQQMSRLMVGSLKSIKDMLAFDQLPELIELCSDMLQPSEERRSIASAQCQSHPISWEDDDQ